MSRRSNPHADRPLRKPRGRSRAHRVVYVAVEGESTEVDKILDDAEDDAEPWVMFDRDEHSEIPEAFARARRNGINVAFSHPSFDLWLLLHFAPFSGAQHGSSEVVHQKLRRQPAFETFALPHGDKGLKRARIEALRGKEPVATHNARRLTKDCATAECSEAEEHADHCSPLRRDPSTDVWQLLASLKIVDVEGVAWRHGQN